MIRLIRMTFFSGWTSHQMVDFMVGMILTIVLLTSMIVFITIFG